jgi:hypothetical protein
MKRCLSYNQHVNDPDVTCWLRLHTALHLLTLKPDAVASMVDIKDHLLVLMVAAREEAIGN